MINLCQPSIHSLRQLAVSLKQSLACIFPRSSPNVKTLALGGFMILKGHQKVKNATDFRNGKWLTNSKATSNCITELNEAHTYRTQRSTYLVTDSQANLDTFPSRQRVICWVRSTCFQKWTKQSLHSALGVWHTWTCRSGGKLQRIPSKLQKELSPSEHCFLWTSFTWGRHALIYNWLT